MLQQKAAVRFSFLAVVTPVEKKEKGDLPVFGGTRQEGVGSAGLEFVDYRHLSPKDKPLRYTQQSLDQSQHDLLLYFKV